MCTFITVSSQLKICVAFRWEYIGITFHCIPMRIHRWCLDCIDSIGHFADGPDGCMMIEGRLQNTPISNVAYWGSTQSNCDALSSMNLAKYKTQKHSTSISNVKYKDNYRQKYTNLKCCMWRGTTRSNWYASSSMNLIKYKIQIQTTIQWSQMFHRRIEPLIKLGCTKFDEPGKMQNAKVAYEDWVTRERSSKRLMIRKSWLFIGIW